MDKQKVLAVFLCRGRLGFHMAVASSRSRGELGLEAPVTSGESIFSTSA